MSTSFAVTAPRSASSSDRGSQPALREKAAEFEGILISEILQKLSECYRVPGEEDSDGAGENFRSMATSALGGGLARSGGLGVGEMLVRQLSSAEGRG